jgi:hypothetical protein
MPHLSEPAAADRRGIGFGWLQNAWLLHARLKIHRGGIDTRSVASTENPRAGSLSCTACAGHRMSGHHWLDDQPLPGAVQYGGSSETQFF